MFLSRIGFIAVVMTAAISVPAAAAPQQSSGRTQELIARQLSVLPHVDRVVTPASGPRCNVLGVVWDETARRAAPAASVALLQLGGEGRVQGSRTDGQGRYRVTMPTGTSWRLLAQLAGTSGWEDGPRVSCPTASLRINPVTKERHWFWDKTA